MVRLRKDLAEKITKNMSVTPEEFDEALNKYIAANGEGFTKDNILCMFLPNTYEVYFNILPEDLIKRMNS
ncbi:MAG: aminodeoxychorismate lyase, partial [Cyclobacteriaceae bacterium]